MDYSKEELEKLQEKNSFLIQKSIYEDLKLMTENEVQYLVLRIFEYVLNGEIPVLDDKKHRFVKSAFNRFKIAYDSDSKKWLKTCKKNKDNADTRWNKKKLTKDEAGNPLEHPDFK